MEGCWVVAMPSTLVPAASVPARVRLWGRCQQRSLPDQGLSTDVRCLDST